MQTLKSFADEEIRLGHIGGAAAALFENGEKTWTYAGGWADPEKGVPITDKTIFRLYSMTKPVIAVMCRILTERGMMKVSAPLADYFPEFEKMCVLENGKRIPARRKIVLEDLLNMQSGIVYPDPDEAGSLMQKQMDELKEEMFVQNRISTEAFVRCISRLPLSAHPGTAWRYGFSADVLGAVIEKICDRPLGEVLKQEIFVPLEMEDTAFYVPEEKQNRLAQLCRPEAGGLRIDRDRHLGLTLMLEPPAFESGGAGLLSTMEDYGHFVEMLSQAGIWKGRRLLTKESIDCFAVNQLKSPAGFDWERFAGYGYGNLMRVSENGTFGWDGWSGVFFAVNPFRQMALLFMTQVSGYDTTPVQRIFEKICP